MELNEETKVATFMPDCALDLSRKRPHGRVDRGAVSIYGTICDDDAIDREGVQFRPTVRPPRRPCFDPFLALLDSGIVVEEGA